MPLTSRGADISIIQTAGKSAAAPATSGVPATPVAGGREGKPAGFSSYLFPFDGQDADEEAGKDGLGPKCEQDDGWDHLAHRGRRVQVSKADRLPAHDGEYQCDQTTQSHQRARQQTDLERAVAHQRLQRRMRRVESLAGR